MGSSVGGRVRVWALAAETGMTTDQVRSRLEQLGWPTKSHASTVPNHVADLFRQVVTPLATRPAPAKQHPYRSLLRYVTARRRGWTAIVVVTLASSGAALLTPWPMKVLTDQVLGHEAISPLLRHLPGGATRSSLITYLALATLVLFAASGALDFVLSTLWVKVGQATVYDVANDLLRRIQRRSVLFHGRWPVGDTMSRVMIDSYALNTVVNMLLFTPAHSIVLIIIMIVLLVRLDPGLTVIAVLAAPGMTVTSILLGRTIRRTARHRREVESGLQSHVHHVLSGIPVVQAFGQEEREHRLFRRFASRAIAIQRRTTVLDKMNQLGSGLVTAVGAGAVLWVGAERVVSGQLSLGSLLVFLAYLDNLHTQCKTLAGIYGTLQAARAGVDRVIDVLEADPEVADRVGARSLGTVRGHVVLEDVWFGYDPDHPVLKDINLQARPGETIAIVGPSGAGKTTLVSLVLRFFDPTRGRVLLDGHDLRDIQLANLRHHVSLVLQESFLFPMSIADNIAYGRPAATRHEIEQAAKAANAHDFISRLPHGYDTVVGERGATLSGGERQRVAIARALLKDAPVLILDEPTSSLDSESERLLLDALDRLMAGRTTFIIAHRLSTIRHADHIIVLQDGHIAEIGNHEELLQASNLYARLHHNQTNTPNRRRVSAG